MSAESISQEARGRKQIRRWSKIDLRAVAPFVALAFLLVLGALSSDRFLTLDNLLNVVPKVRLSLLSRWGRRL